MQKHFSLRIRYLVSFLLLVMLMAVFSIYICQSNFETSRTYTAQLTSQTFSNVRNDISSILTRCENLADTVVTAVCEDNLYLDELGKTRVQWDSRIFPLLEGVEAQISMSSDVLMYIRGDAYIYTSQEKMLYEAYASHTQNGLLLDEAGLFTQMLRLTQPALIPIDSENEAPHIAYIVPVSNEGFSRIIMIYLFSYDTFTAEFEKYLGEAVADLYIHTHDLRMIYQNEHSVTQPNLPLTRIYRVKGSGVINVREKETDYTLLREYDREHDLTYVMLSDNRHFYSSLDPSHVNQIVLLAVLISALIVLAFILTHFNYQPIYMLTHDILGHKPPQKSNELDIIKTQYHASQKQVQELNAIAVNHFLSRLTSNSIASRSEYDYLLMCAGINFPYAQFAFLYILFPSGASRDSREKAIEVCDEFQYDGCMTLTGHLYQEHALCVLLCFEKTSGDEPVPLLFAQALHERLKEQTFQQLRIGIGGTCSDPLKLTSSYLEASAAVQMASVNDEKYVLAYEAQAQDPDSQSQNFGMTLAQKSLLTELLRHGETALALESFESIASSLTESASSLLILRYFSTDLFNLIITQARSFQVEVSNHEIENLLHFNSSREFYVNGSRFLRDICDRIHVQIQHNQVESRKRVIVYIQEHFKEYDLSVQNVADALDIPRQQVTEVLKEDVGQGFMQYVSSLRMQEFKRLLLTTDGTVQSLISEVGYLDGPNFLRKFKAAEGVTPTQFRALYQTNET